MDGNAVYPSWKRWFIPLLGFQHVSTIRTWWCRISLAHPQYRPKITWNSFPSELSPRFSGTSRAPELAELAELSRSPGTAIWWTSKGHRFNCHRLVLRGNSAGNYSFSWSKMGEMLKNPIILDQQIEYHMIKLIIKILLKPYETTYKCLALTHYVSFRLWIDAFKLLSLRPVQKNL